MAAPQVGEEQPLSSTAKAVSSWTVLDISAAFPGGKTPHSTKAVIILGADLPCSGLLGRLRVRKFGDTTSYEEATTVIGITSIVYRDDGKYQSGGFSGCVEILVDADGKFEYQLQNDSGAPRTIIQLLEVTTVEEVQEPVPSSEKGEADGIASLNESALVTQNPASATVTPGPGKIPLADESGKIDGWVTPPSLPWWESITVEASHTGDTNETELGKITIPANKMGPNGHVKIYAAWRTLGSGGAHHFRVYFGGTRVSFYYHGGAGVSYEMIRLFVWNMGVTNLQGRGTSRGQLHASTVSGNLSEDTTLDVDVSFRTILGDPADTTILRFALVKAYHKD